MRIAYRHVEELLSRGICSADNFTANAGSGGDTFAADDIASVKYPRSKIVIGADGTNDGDVSSANPMPVTGTITAVTTITNAVTVNAHAVTNAGTFAVQEDGAALTALQLIDDAVYTDGTGTPSKGIAVMGTDGTNPQLISVDSTGNVQVDLVTANVTNAGTFAVQVDGDALTALQLIDDVVVVDDAAYTAASGKGVPLMAFATSDAVDSGDIGAVAMDTSRNLKVSIEVDNAGIGGGTQYTEDAAAAANPVGNATILVRADTPGAVTSTDGDNVAQRGTNYGAAYVQVVDSAGSFVDTFGGGTQYTEDAAAAADPVGNASILVRANKAAAVASANGDNVAQRGSNFGAGYIHTLDTQGNNAFTPGFTDVFGHLPVGSINNQVDIQFFRDTPGNLVTVAVNGTNGTAASNAGGALFSSSTDTNGEVKGTTSTTTLYRSGSEVYAIFTAAWLDGGAATSFQRIGLFDANNGFFIGFENTTFGVTYRNNTSDTSVALANFSEDALDGSANSLFTRAGSPEAMDTTKLNVFRIRFGWLGSAPIYWEVMAPDGHWVTFHKTLFPNLQNTPSVRDADLPMELFIQKTAGAGNLRMQTDCWGAGVTLNALKLNDTITNATIAPVTRSVIAAYNGSAYANVTSTASGNLKVSIEEFSNGVDVGNGTVGSETLRVTIASDTTGVLSVDDNSGSLTVDNAGTFATQVDGAALTALQLIDDAVHADDAAFTLGTSKGVMVMGFAGTQSVDANDAAALACDTDGALHIADGGNSITVDNGGTFVVQVDGTALTRLTDIETNTDYGAVVGGGVEATALRVTLASDSTGVISIDDNAGSLTVDNGGTFVVQEDGAALTALQLIDDPVKADDAAFTIGTDKVMVAGGVVDDASTDSADEGDAAAIRLTADRKVTVHAQPHTTGGLSISRDIDLDNGTLTVVKASAGMLYGMTITNTSTATVFVKFYNAASGTLGTGTPVLTIGIPGNSTDDTLYSETFPVGVEFSTGICVGAGTGVADADNTDPGTNAVVANIFYK